MLNRTIQVKVAKPEKSMNDSSDDTTLSDRMYIVHETLKSIGVGAAKFMTLYMVLDTARRVADNLTTK